MSNLSDNLLSALHGASNAAASNVSGPVDALAWALRKVGVPVPSNAFGGSEWMRQQGLTADPRNRLAGLLGEGVGLAAPFAIAAKAPQIAGGLLKADDALTAGANRMADHFERTGAAYRYDPKQRGAVGVNQPSDLEALRNSLAQSGVDLSAYASNAQPDVVTLSKLVVPKEMRGQGVGSAAMDELVKYADDAGKTIALSPSTDFGASSVSRLKDFYKRFGFVDNKGRGKDFAISESMYRHPKTNAEANALAAALKGPR